MNIYYICLNVYRSGIIGLDSHKLQLVYLTRLCENFQLLPSISSYIMVGFFFLLLVVSSVHCSHFRASEVDSLIELELEFLGKFKNYAKELREKLRLVEG